MPKAIDTHAHLDHVKNVDEALKEAQAAGVVGVVAVGIDLIANRRNLEIKKRTQNPKVHLAFGMHPESLENNIPGQVDECVEFIRANIKEAVAIGEIGLDYWYKWARKNDDKKKEQRDVFASQLNLAKEFDLPVVIHSRGSWRDCLDMVKAAGIKKANFHWYSGPLDILDEIVACGYVISASPALAYSPQHQDAVKHVPIEHLLIETDSPVFYGDFTAAPKDVLRTLKIYSSLKAMKEDEAAEVFYRNAVHFFNLPEG